MATKTPRPDDIEFDPAESEALRQLSRQVREIPYLAPPACLLSGVMGAVRARRFPLWYRSLRWARSPKSLTFTPLQVASLTSFLVLVCFAGAFFLLKSEYRPDAMSLVQGSVPITFTLNMPEARSVSVVGTFNAWQEKGYEMTRDPAKGRWTLILRLPGGRYEYAFILDGQKLIPDPEAEFLADDGFGNQNAVLIVGKYHDQAI